MLRGRTPVLLVYLLSPCGVTAALGLGHGDIAGRRANLPIATTRIRVTGFRATGALSPAAMLVTAAAPVATFSATTTPAPRPGTA